MLHMNIVEGTPAKTPLCSLRSQSDSKPLVASPSYRILADPFNFFLGTRF